MKKSLKLNMTFFGNYVHPAMTFFGNGVKFSFLKSVSLCIFLYRNVTAPCLSVVLMCCVLMCACVARQPAARTAATPWTPSGRSTRGASARPASGGPPVSNATVDGPNHFTLTEI